MYLGTAVRKADSECFLLSLYSSFSSVQLTVSEGFWGRDCKDTIGNPLTYCDGRLQAAGVVLSRKGNEVSGIGCASLGSAALQQEGGISVLGLDQQEVPQPIEGEVGIIQSGDVGITKCPS